MRTLLDSWRSPSGLWTFLAFSMQMCLVLVSGHALAASAPVRRVLESVAAWPRSPAGAAATVALVACLASLINWGLGLIVGAFLAREVGRSLTRRGVRHHYPLLVAAGFAGFLPWHGGLSGSAPLTMTSAESMAKVLPKSTIDALTTAGLGGGIPLSQTLFSPLNLVITGGLLLLIPACAALLTPRHGRDLAIAPLDPPPASAAEPGADGPSARRTPADFLDHSRVINTLLGLALLAGFLTFAVDGGAGVGGVNFARLQRIGLNEVNLVILALGLLLHESPRSYLAAVEDGARGCAGVIMQFPLYGGIVALLAASGLDRQIASALGGVADHRSLPVFTFWCAGLLNIFIPSGGGQWGVQGPIALESALALGAPPAKVTMAVAYGDQLTNMLQPFWALPLLAITGARARDIVGYTTLIMLVALAWISVVLWLM